MVGCIVFVRSISSRTNKPNIPFIGGIYSYLLFSLKRVRSMCVRVFVCGLNGIYVILSHINISIFVYGQNCPPLDYLIGCDLNRFIVIVIIKIKREKNDHLINLIMLSRLLNHHYIQFYEDNKINMTGPLNAASRDDFFFLYY